MRRILFVFSLILNSLFSFSQSDSIVIGKIAVEILTQSKAYENLRTLTKSIGPRLSGSPQTYTSEKWGEEVLKKSGADRVYLEEAKIPHWVRGPKEKGVLISGKSRENLAVIALGNSVATPPSGITAPVILIHNFDELERRKGELKGNIVFYDYPFDLTNIWLFKSYSEAVTYRGSGASRAAKYGAVAVVVRSMTCSTDNLPHTGAMTYNDSFPKIPALAIGLKDADKLASAITRGSSPKLLLYTGAHKLPDTVGYNVVGEWRGSEFPDQIITVGGHLDSWDPAEGAQDDGAGIVQSIEVMRALKAAGIRPRHTIRVVLFTDEENGGRGAKVYAHAAVTKNEKHIFALESDAGGFTPREFSFKGSEEQINALRSWLPLFYRYGVTGFTANGGGSDVDALNDSTGVLVSELVPDSQRYFDYHHAASDTFEQVNKRELELGAINMAALIYLIDKYGL